MTLKQVMVSHEIITREFYTAFVNDLLNASRKRGQSHPLHVTQGLNEGIFRSDISQILYYGSL